MIRTPTKKRSPRAPPRAAPVEEEEDEVDASSPPGMAAEDEEDLRSDFFANFDPNAFLAELDAYTTSRGGASAGTSQMSALAPPRPPPPSAPSGSAPVRTPAAAQPAPAPANAQQSSDFYGTAIQILTHILGSSTPLPWLASDTSRPDDPDTPGVWNVGQSPMITSGSSAQGPDLQHLINVLVARLGGSAQPPQHRLREQDLTKLLQSLLHQQQQQQQQAASLFATSPAVTTGEGSRGAQGFADLNLPEEEDEDEDPDFLPLPADAQRSDAAIPSNSAWTKAVQEVVGVQPAPLGVPDLMGSSSSVPALSTSPAKATRTQKRQQLEQGRHEPPAAEANEPPRPPKSRPGRLRIYTEEEAAERKRERNRKYAKRLRSQRRNERLGLTAEQDADRAASPDGGTASPPPSAVHNEMMLSAENRFLRAEVERLQEENARLRGREEMRAYVARLHMRDEEAGIRPRAADRLYDLESPPPRQRKDWPSQEPRPLESWQPPSASPRTDGAYAYWDRLSHAGRAQANWNRPPPGMP